MVFKTSETETESNFLSSVTNFTIIRTLLGLALQRKWYLRHTDLQSAFRKGKLERLVYAAFPKYRFADRTRANHVKISKKSLYELHDAARIWFKLLIDIFQLVGLKYLKTTPFIICKRNTVVARFADDLLLFVKLYADVEKLKSQLKPKLVVPDPGKSTHVLNIELNWAPQGSAGLPKTTLIENLLSTTKISTSMFIGSPTNSMSL